MRFIISDDNGKSLNFNMRLSKLQLSFVKRNEYEYVAIIDVITFSFGILL